MEPTPIRLFSPLANRDGSVLKDSRLVNGFAEKAQEGDEVHTYKRPGLIFRSTVAAGQVGRGVHNWNEDIYTVFGNTLYKNGVAKGTVDPSGLYSFESCLGATPKLTLKNEAHAYNYDDGAGLVAVVDADYPAVTVPGIVYLDGTTYVFDTTNVIHGDDFNDPTSWDPLNVILAQITPDPPIAIAKQLVYVVAFKGVSTEVFYDAGNATGSPLGSVQGSKMNVGCRAAGTLKDVGGDLCWVGTTTLGDVGVMLMSQVKGEPISTPPVDRLLGPLDYSVAWSWAMKVAGHKYYVVTLPLSNLTLAFDLTVGTWYQWTDASGLHMPIIASSYDAQTRPILQHATNGNLYTADTSSLTDDGTPFPWALFTPNFDGGLRLNKSCGGVEVVGDESAAIVGVSWSDDDYTTFRPDISVSMAQERPWVPDGSSFRKRAWRLTNTSGDYLRLRRLDATITPGTL